MIEINIPGYRKLRIQHLVSDVNGTLAVDGSLLPGVAEALGRLRSSVEIHLLTADTHGRQKEIDRVLGLTAVHIQAGGEAEQKAAYVRQLGAEQVAALGQGANDAEMLRASALGICVLSAEGTAREALLAADILLPDVIGALALLENPLRIAATLRR